MRDKESFQAYYCSTLSSQHLRRLLGYDPSYKMRVAAHVELSKRSSAKIKDFDPEDYKYLTY